MQLQMLRHSGLLCYRELDPLQGKASIDLVHAWKGWKEYETKNRYTFWFIVRFYTKYRITDQSDLT